ncbi:hypothetical protein [Paenibacillus eucommiae]|uniref:Uncharacterized protein n=1 Tax=Paenibacillus eucommiae TaxID=1355755 RepID=A0ABS4IUL4_9BACL|nr:hypothetical protein [Paenibacillus eucommiae]MBP1991248.1 hypothetical protein [Paenibacillus eucommiae]
MALNKQLFIAPVSSQVCGIVYDPLTEEAIHTCEDCEEGECRQIYKEREREKEKEDEDEVHPFYLGACGLIMEYML